MKKNLGELTTVLLTAQPQFVTDTVRLLNDFMTWLIVISLPAGVLLGGYAIFKWSHADENSKSQEEKKAKRVCFGVVGVIVIEAVLKLIVSYYVH